MNQNRMDVIKELFDNTKGAMYTSLVIRGKDLYERIYCTYDRPDYEVLLRDLSEDEIQYAISLGAYYR